MAFYFSIKIFRQTSAIQKNLERYHSRFLAVFSIIGKSF
ncbi:hypothetical protein SPAR76_1568 [Streptococcus pneumoniae GA43264]|nr:hypothetical protein SPAR87_1018 [Streptococcus pneumoniae GA47033]EHD41672.1 hypothetical protein SPAR77_1498 [Streptococcus pneumoniae GA43265]EHD58720.1 hypothetical protein SPAR70_1520 [Streptococcus pneumoniae GA41410]EHD68310.1 hypothetical protein SPAR124_1445 [Streptococcus pneumoniae 6963-05]EHE17930.1 hypothetical protein SPAR67_1498 [Streptococcus pneumoniae GA41277]EHE50144.1 hypothetical protein SPAR147_1469 [Streptococcus pneumoniae Netherlands15B-37]EHE77566.1 hypothetical p